MTKYNTLNVKFSNSQLNKLKSEIKNGTRVTLNLSSNVVGDSSNETNFPYKLLLTDTQVSRIRKAFANGSSANIKFSKTHQSKGMQLGGSIFNQMLGPFNPFKIFNSLGNSVIYKITKEKKVFPKTQKRRKIFY